MIGAAFISVSEPALAQTNTDCQRKSLDKKCLKTVSGEIQGVFQPVIGSGVVETFAIIWIFSHNTDGPWIFAQTYLGKSQNLPEMYDQCTISYLADEMVEVPTPFITEIIVTDDGEIRTPDGRPIILHTLNRARDIDCEKD